MSAPKVSWALLSVNKLPPGSFAEGTLGCVVEDIDNPTDDCFPTKNTEILQRAKISKVFEMDDTNAEHFQSTVNDPEIRLKLTEIFSSRITDSTDSRISISSQTVVTRILTSHREAFNALKAIHDNELRRRLKDNNGTVYMIVGFKTCVNADISSYFKQVNEASADITIPLDKILTALGLPLTFGADLSAAARLKMIKEHLSKHIAAGERIFAVQYRQITTERTWRKKRTWIKKEITLGKHPYLQTGLMGEDDVPEVEEEDTGGEQTTTAKDGHIKRENNGDEDDGYEEEGENDQDEDTTALCLHEVQPLEFEDLGADFFQESIST